MISMLISATNAIINGLISGTTNLINLFFGTRI